MCCGSGDSAPAYHPAANPDPEGVPADDQRYRVSYFNGTFEDVTGLAEAQRKLFQPETRAEGTDREGFAGGSYARI